MPFRQFNSFDSFGVAGLPKVPARLFTLPRDINITTKKTSLMPPMDLPFTSLTLFSLLPGGGLSLLLLPLEEFFLAVLGVGEVLSLLGEP